MNKLASFDKTSFTGLYGVRNAILDYCSSPEKASEIIGQVFRKCTAVETNRKIKAITEFELRHICIDDSEECIDIHLLNSRNGETLDVLRLHYRNNELTPLTAEQEAESEKIPVTLQGRKVRNITPERMHKMLNNSKSMFCESVMSLATSIIDAFINTSSSDQAVFHLEIHKRYVTMHAQVQNSQAIHLSLPLVWFSKKKDKPLVAQDVTSEGYIFEPS